jgi:hypothetical protein
VSSQTISESVEDYSQLLMIVIERQPTDVGQPWQNRYKLIEGALKRHPEVFDLAVDYNGHKIYIALSGDIYDSDELIRLDAEFRQIITRCTTLA